MQNNPGSGNTPNKFDEYLSNNPMANAGLQMAQAAVANQLKDQPIDLNSFPMSLFNYPSIKAYFDIHPMYVLKKLQMVIFPFIPEAEEKPKGNQDDGPQSFNNNQTNPDVPKERSKYQPDLYIPAMAFMTYIQLTCQALGIKNNFSPTQFSKIA